MIKSFNKKEIVELMADCCHGSIETCEDGYYVKIVRREQVIQLPISNEHLDNIIERLCQLNVNDETSLYDDKNYEIIVKEETTSPVGRIREDKIEVHNDDIGITYELSRASDEYLIFILDSIKNRLSPRDFRFGFFFSPRIERILEEDETINLIDFIRLTSFRLLTLKIRSDNKTSFKQFTKLSHSFFFHIGYNLDVALVPQRLLEEIARRGRISRMRRARAEELDPPRRFYNEDLVQHYLLAVSTDNPVIEYLSYYHILEHFFELVFNDDLIESIKTKITDPGFSYKRKKDISQLVTSIKRSLQIRSQTITFSESEALRLCLIKFVNLSKLKQKLLEYDDSIVAYYQANKVEFSGGIEFDLDNSDHEKVIKNLTKRIYSTRNSLVHSKDGDKSKYTPFRDDRILVKEVPLMRFISEMVILSESNVQ